MCMHLLLCMCIIVIIHACMIVYACLCVNICGGSGTAMHGAASGGHTDILKVTLRQRNVHEYLSSGAQMGIVRMYSPITCWRSIKCSSLAYYE